MYLIKYKFSTQKTIRQEGFIFTDYITRTTINEGSKIVDTYEEVKSFNEELTNGSIVSVTQIS